MRRAIDIVLSGEQRVRLNAWARGRRTPVQLAERARIILLAAEGMRDKDIAARLLCDRRTCARWRKRFADSGLAGIEHDAPRPQTARRIAHETVLHIVHKTTLERTPDGKRWSTRTLARMFGVSEASVRRIWRAQGITPHAHLPTPPSA